MNRIKKSLGKFKSRNVIVVYNALSTTNSEINFTKLKLIIIFKIKEPRLHRLYGETHCTTNGIGVEFYLCTVLSDR